MEDKLNEVYMDMIINERKQKEQLVDFNIAGYESKSLLNAITLGIEDFARKNKRGVKLILKKLS